MTRVMQIIAGALMFGVLGFGAFAVANSQGKEPDEQSLMPIIAIGITVMELMAYAVVPGMFANAQLKQIEHKNDSQDESQLIRQLCGVYQTKMIIGMALLEGVAFLNIVAYMQTLQWWSLGIAGILLFGMLVTFPTGGKVDFWIQDQRQLLDLEQ